MRAVGVSVGKFGGKLVCNRVTCNKVWTSSSFREKNSLLFCTWMTFEARPLLKIWHELSNVSGPHSQSQDRLFVYVPILVPWRETLRLKREEEEDWAKDSVNIFSNALIEIGFKLLTGPWWQESGAREEAFLHCKCNFLFFLIAHEALENSYQICFFMSHFLQVEPLIIPIPIVISFFGLNYSVVLLFTELWR